MMNAEVNPSSFTTAQLRAGLHIPVIGAYPVMTKRTFNNIIICNVLNILYTGSFELVLILKAHTRFVQCPQFARLNKIRIYDIQLNVSEICPLTTRAKASRQPPPPSPMLTM